MRGWLDWFFGLPRKVAQEILGMLQGALNAVVDWAQDAFNWLSGWVQSLSDFVGSTFRGFADWINGIITWADNTIRGTFDYAIRLVTGWINDVENWAQGWFNWAVDNLHAIGDWVRHEFDATVSWVQHSVFDVLGGMIQSLGDWVSKTVIPWIESRIGGAISYVLAQLHSASDFFLNAVRHVLDPVITYIDGVIKAWDWIVWFATHSFHALYELVFGSVNLDPRRLLGMLSQQFLQHGDEAEQILARWLFGVMFLPLSLFGVIRRRTIGRRRFRGRY